MRENIRLLFLPVYDTLALECVPTALLSSCSLASSCSGWIVASVHQWKRIPALTMTLDHLVTLA